MHRHHLPECKGTFIEEWHQKLHNNSTPDDIIICEAYLAFLHSGGNLDEFWRCATHTHTRILSLSLSLSLSHTHTHTHRVIHENGITRDTLRKYERAITTDPVFFADKKVGLIADFNNYLRILKNVHAGLLVCVCVCLCVFVCVLCVYVCSYTHVYACTYICIHTYTCRSGLGEVCGGMSRLPGRTRGGPVAEHPQSARGHRGPGARGGRLHHGSAAAPRISAHQRHQYLAFCVKGNNILLLVSRGRHEQTPRHALYIYIYILIIYINYIY